MGIEKGASVGLTRAASGCMDRPCALLGEWAGVVMGCKAPLPSAYLLFFLVALHTTTQASHQPTLPLTTPPSN
jgi:hypothetical protein